MKISLREQIGDLHAGISPESVPRDEILPVQCALSLLEYIYA